MIKTLAIAACTVALTGCGTTGSHMTPEQAKALIDSFHAAGCGGSVSLNAGAAGGQLGGAAHLDLALNGSCPTATQATWGSTPPAP